MVHMSFQIQDRNTFQNTELELTIARIVIGADDEILYASERFMALCDHEGEDAAEFKASDLFKLKGNKKPANITSGTHEIILKNNKLSLTLHFDRIESSGSGQSLLVGSEIDPDMPDQISRPEMEMFVERLKLRSIDNIQDSLMALSRHNIGSLDGNSDLKCFLDMSHDVMIVTDEQLIRVNDTFSRLLGYDENEATDLRFFDLFDAMDRGAIRTTMQNLIASKEAVNVIDFEAEIKTKSGQTLIMEWRQSHKDHFIYCVGRDLTAIKRHEKEVSKHQEQLDEAEILGRMGRWRWEIGQDDIEWSDQIYRIFGLKREEFTPSIDGLSAHVHRRDVGRVIQGFQRAIIEQNDYDMEFRITRPNGEVRFIRCEGRCERDDDGDVIALYGIMQDMTERMLYERELKQAIDAAERAYAAKSQFLANMSHELRTPLKAIIGFSEMMQRQLLGPIGTEKYLDYIGGIRESGEHLLDLISDILDMSKIEAGKHEMDWEEINVTKIIKLATHMMEGRAQESGITISTKALKNDSLSIIADRRAFMQVMLNLMSNAVKFSKDNGQVWIECQEREDFISIRVCDNGVGIPANKLQCITQPFEQAASSYNRPYEGSGLGLAITKELVEMHGGTLLIDSTVDVGTTVTVRLPYDAAEKMKKKTGQKNA